MSLFGTATRDMRVAEIALARRVFGATLPFDRITLRENNGIGGRPFTMVDSISRHYVLHLGPRIYPDATSVSIWSLYTDGSVHERYCDVFIHELTHVWQGEHRGGFVWNSLWHQAVDDDAYAYTPGQNWGSYNVEQQAQIVEDWFNPRIGNQSDTDARYRYITANIRAGVGG